MNKFSNFPQKLVKEQLCVKWGGGVTGTQTQDFVGENPQATAGSFDVLWSCGGMFSSPVFLLEVT